MYRALLYCCPGKDSISWLPAAPTDCACPITDLDKFELKSSSHSQGVGVLIQLCFMGESGVVNACNLGLTGFTGTVRTLWASP